MERNYSDNCTSLWYDDSVRVEGFKDEFRFLSNFWAAPILYNGDKWSSVEQAYQAYKSNDPEVRKLFQSLTSAEAKKLGREIEIREDWEFVKDHIMYNLVCEKFMQNEHLADMLLATRKSYLEETNWWNDTYWGVCNGKGQNKLGKILMQVREILYADRTRCKT